MQKATIANEFIHLQDAICHSIETSDQRGKFKEDLWERPGGGGGKTRILTQGDVIEKGGVNFSQVQGATPKKIAEALGTGEADFFATGLSIVMHPHSPMVPIIHMNVRYFEMGHGMRWFGGGIDLTPHYIDPPDARFFHQKLKACCDRHHADYYPKFKAWADDYFYIPHRKETRGIGGVFFDRLTDTPAITLGDRWAFVKDMACQFIPIYTSLIDKNKALPYGENERRWQYLRRGRYAEFNLVWDKGTKFGLDTEGRTESILMSLPPQATWEYAYEVPTGSKEAQTMTWLKKGVEWV